MVLVSAAESRFEVFPVGVKVTSHGHANSQTDQIAQKLELSRAISDRPPIAVKPTNRDHKTTHAQKLKTAQQEFQPTFRSHVFALMIPFLYKLDSQHVSPPGSPLENRTTTPRHGLTENSYLENTFVVL